jgi:hypothetical protein
VLGGASEDEANEAEDRAFVEGRYRTGSAARAATANEPAQRHQVHPYQIYADSAPRRSQIPFVNVGLVGYAAAG